MKAIVIEEHGAPDVLTLVDVPLPIPRPDEVLVQNHVIGVNFVDTQHRAGGYYPVTLPLIPGIEAAGVVSAVGSAVTDFKVGDRVAYAGYMGGNYADYTAVPQGRLVTVPDDISFEQAAATLMQGLTAYVFTHEVYPVKAGDTVLVHAAAGGVGLLLVQIAKQRGATVIGTVSSALKAQTVAQHGAEVIVTATSDFVSEVMRLTEQRGVNVVYDGIGGTVFEPSLQVLKTRGYMVEYGQSGGVPQPFDVTSLSGITGSPNKGSLFVTWASAGDYLAETAELRRAASGVFDMLRRGDVRQHIMGIYPLAEAATTHHLLASRTTIGKLLLRPTH